MYTGPVRSGLAKSGLRGLIQTVTRNCFTLLDACVSSLRRGHAKLLCFVPILTDDPQRESSLIQTMMWMIVFDDIAA